MTQKVVRVFDTVRTTLSCMEHSNSMSDLDNQQSKRRRGGVATDVLADAGASSAESIVEHVGWGVAAVMVMVLPGRSIP